MNEKASKHFTEDFALLYLSEMILNRHTVLNRVQEDLKTIHEVFQQQVSVAAMIQFQWNYIKSEESCVLGTPASKIRTISTQTKDLMQTKEKILRMGVRFLYTSLYYKEVAHLGDRHVNVPVEEWDREAESMLLQLDKNKKRFEEVISEMESELEKAEKDFNEGLCYTNVEHINNLFRKAFENLTASDKDDAEKRFADVQKKTREQSKEILRIKQMMGVPKRAVDPGNGNDPKSVTRFFRKWSRKYKQMKQSRIKSHPHAYMTMVMPKKSEKCDQMSVRKIKMKNQKDDLKVIALWKLGAGSNDQFQA
uniref:IQ domain-containing protein G n=1 Tax=Haemonchus placei TaxID=6290 RepID=A0A0N4X7B9_HAEPC